MAAGRYLAESECARLGNTVLLAASACHRPEDDVNAEDRQVGPLRFVRLVSAAAIAPKLVELDMTAQNFGNAAVAINKSRNDAARIDNLDNLRAEVTKFKRDVLPLFTAAMRQEHKVALWALRHIGILLP
ncbi:hypothetical protein JKP88DRAFT_248437 [Tribonema minus]|uniref:Uncharacterized protein n=1 Tax=Tribonema minus TaxID=303371 RepID=A0A835YMK3_9STRA|nr:hypothetical protein JKP88DRAFT_248437 [Tribonema minus]